MGCAPKSRTMRYLVVVETVTDAAAISDYLQDRVESGDEVHAVTVHPPDASTPDSDRREALNVVRVRLAVPAVETLERRGSVDDELATVLEERTVDEIVVGHGAAVDLGDVDGVDSGTAEVVTVPEDN